MVYLGGVTFKPNKTFPPHITFDQGLCNSNRSHNKTEIGPRGINVLKYLAILWVDCEGFLKFGLKKAFECSVIKNLWELEDNVESSEFDGTNLPREEKTIRAIYVIFSLTNKWSLGAKESAMINKRIYFALIRQLMLVCW